eukprot:TRINITY_DN21676_c0_g1_i1.p1 TRINITY_DN21676_c0_g1~~TRINITY_DN21676_c0_g1_i1.p1  ORF type:complete len:339 (+),score=51.18 TRINITY_DN21676_c0_g1_i1:31-1047(+)
MPFELATPMYVPVLPDPECVQLECGDGQVAQVILSKPVNPELLEFPPGFFWIPGQLLQATARGSASLAGPTQEPLGSVADVMQVTPSRGEVVNIAGCSDAAIDNADLEAALEPALRAVLARDQFPHKAGAGHGKGVRWWNCPEPPLLCPLTGFPICLLPYPPFKLRTDAKCPSPHRLVDGKFLALCIIAKGCHHACGRKLQTSDISAIDDYFYRCKLGNLRPGRVAALEKEAREAPDLAQRVKARRDLDGMVMIAGAELCKLCRIQDRRLLQINRMMPACAQATLKSMRNSLLTKIFETSTAEPSKSSSANERGRCSSSASMSTQAVTCSGSSDASQE